MNYIFTLCHEKTQGHNHFQNWFGPGTANTLPPPLKKAWRENIVDEKFLVWLKAFVQFQRFKMADDNHENEYELVSNLKNIGYS